VVFAVMVMLALLIPFAAPYWHPALMLVPEAALLHEVDAWQTTPPDPQVMVPVPAAITAAIAAASAAA
jgi:hypothetical protein